MTPESLIASIRALCAQYEIDLVPALPPPPTKVVVMPGDDIQAAFATGLPVHLVAGQTYPGLTLPSGAWLVGNGAAVVGVGKPALYAAPGSIDIYARDLVCTSDYVEGVVVLGDNSATTQGTAALVPKGIILTRVKVPTHRGKRAFAVHAEATLIDCEALDVFFPGTPGAGTDSQGIWIHNTTGNVRVIGGHYQGGSECVMTAGDAIHLSDTLGCKGLLFDGVLFDRPLAWKGATDYYRQVKNIFELKNAEDVLIKNCTLRNCWKEGQDGYAFMLTPTRGGRVVNVTIENCTVENVSGGINITGADSSALSSIRTTGINVIGGTFTIDHLTYGGLGRFILASNGPSATGSLTAGTIDVNGATIHATGTSFVYTAGANMQRVCVCNSSFNVGSYGFNIAGGANAASWAAGVAELIVTGNTITGAASLLKTNLAAIGKTPINTYV